MNKGRQLPVGLIVITGFVVIIAVFCITQLEIVPGKRWVGPSREIRANQFHALEKWLRESGRPVRIIPEGNLDTLLNAPEKTIFLETSCLRWNSDLSLLIPWLEEGNQLIISIDNNVTYQLQEFMESLGITAVSLNDDYFDIDSNGDETDSSSETESEEPVYFDWNVSFDKTEGDTPPKYRAEVMNSGGKTRLVRLETGKGSLTFLGKANFAKNYSLHEKQNAETAAEIFLSDIPEDGEGILFIRPITGERHFLGNLAERGNPTALFVSLVLLVIAGFWMTIPLFGRYRPAPEKPGKPLQERFLAEGHFLKKNHALGKYIETYQKELEQLSGGRMYTASENTAQTADNGGTALQEISFTQFLNHQRDLTDKIEIIKRERT